MDRIVVGVDDSSGARLALRWAVEEARQRGASLTVVHCYDVTYGWIDDPAEVEGWQKRAAADGLRSVDALLSEMAPEPDLKVETVVMDSDSAAGLLEAAAGADLLVVGSRGRGGFAGMVLGSVSLQCVLHAPCPVVVVHPNATGAS